jgi:hypothetical protein
MISKLLRMFEVVLKLKFSLFVCYLCGQRILFGAYRLGVLPLALVANERL